MRHRSNSAAFHMLPATEPRLASGALVAALTSSLYLVGAWGLYQIALPAGKRWALAIFALLIFGFANAPLAHAAFYFVGMAYKSILIVPEAAHPVLLELGRGFSRVLTISYAAALSGIVLGVLLLSVRVGCGGTLLPRWAALVINPISLAGLGELVPRLMPEPLRTWLGGAGISIGTLILFSFSAWLVESGRPLGPPKLRATR
jgi:hypothetical protein